MGPGGIHSRGLRELVDEPTELLSIIYWWAGEVPEDWGSVNVTPISKKAERRIWRASSLWAWPRPQGRLWNRSYWAWPARARPSQHLFMTGRSCLTDLTLQICHSPSATALLTIVPSSRAAAYLGRLIETESVGIFCGQFQWDAVTSEAALYTAKWESKLPYQFFP